MQISRDSMPDASLLSLVGRLDELATAEVEQAFTNVLNNENQGLIVDLAGVEYVSSSGLRVLLMLMKAMKNQQRPLKLCNLSPFVAEVFEVSNFAVLFDIYDSLDAAKRASGDA
ncbi:MAG: STAS domain-containing protein [Candidatus Hydrogenedentes bacterium]|nr:STAS domain-containing protein [Candidatus Hydrogenedentota bacterium]